jgi:tRNA(Leu) C34 or U34 (ribose-2'-O)-methylase TrmL
MEMMGLPASCFKRKMVMMTIKMPFIEKIAIMNAKMTVMVSLFEIMVS